MDWKSKLVVTLLDGDNEPVVITPLSNFTPTINSPKTVIHSIEADNVGYNYQPSTYTFTMMMPANGVVLARMTQIAMNGDEFGIAVAEQVGEDWAIKAINLTRCVVNSANPSNVVIEGVPQASFNCMALGFSFEAPQ